jgi:hypothetical protein
LGGPAVHVGPGDRETAENGLLVRHHLLERVVVEAAVVAAVAVVVEQAGRVVVADPEVAQQSRGRAGTFDDLTSASRLSQRYSSSAKYRVQSGSRRSRRVRILSAWLALPERRRPRPPPSSPPWAARRHRP